MKWIVIFLGLLVVVSNNAVAELTPQDLESIRQIVEQVVDEKVIESEKRTDAKLDRLQSETNLKFDKLQAEINGIKWWLGGLTAIITSSIAGIIAIVIYVLNYTSKEVEKVKEHRDAINKYGERIFNLFENFDNLFGEFNQTFTLYKEHLRDHRIINHSEDN